MRRLKHKKLWAEFNKWANERDKDCNYPSWIVQRVKINELFKKYYKLVRK